MSWEEAQNQRGWEAPGRSPGREEGDVFPSRAEFLKAIVDEEVEWRARVAAETERQRQARGGGRGAEQIAFRAVETQQAPVRAKMVAPEELHPWKLMPLGEGIFTIRQGTIGGEPATLGGVLLDAGPTVDLSADGSLYWKITAEPLTVNDGTIAEPYYLIAGAEVQTVEVVTSDGGDTLATVDVDAGTTTDGIYYVLFATVVDGEVTYNRRFDMAFSLCDLDSEGVHSLWIVG